MMGASALCPLELLTLLIGSGGREHSVSEVAGKLLGVHGIAKLGTLRPHELTDTRGIGLAAACRIAAAFELGRRWHQSLEQERGSNGPVANSHDAVGLFRSVAFDCEVENLLVMGLDARRNVLFVEKVAVGGLSSCAAAPCDVFRLAVRQAASAIIVSHNHPSGSDEPSPDDFLFTERLRRASLAVGIELLDHLVLGQGSHFSFADHGMMEG